MMLPMLKFPHCWCLSFSGNSHPQMTFRQSVQGHVALQATGYSLHIGDIYKLRLNTWNTKYPQNVTCVCKNILLNTYYLNVLLPQSYFRKMEMTLILATT